MKLRFSQQLGLQVAMAAAYEAIRGAAGVPTYAMLTEIRGTGLETVFAFTGGTVVKVHFIDMIEWEPWRERTDRNEADQRDRLCLTKLEVNYRPPTKSWGISPKVSETWGKDRLLDLKQEHHLRVRIMAPEEIKGRVGVFVDHPAGEGFVEVDPDRDCLQGANLIRSFEYHPFVEGELESAVRAAEACLAKELASNCVAVFRCSDDDYLVVDSPTGNWQGSGYAPYQLVRWWEFDPSDEASRQAALAQANTFVEQEG